MILRKWVTLSAPGERRSHMSWRRQSDSPVTSIRPTERVPLPPCPPILIIESHCPRSNANLRHERQDALHPFAIH